mgnify:CR=1 FL=1
MYRRGSYSRHLDRSHCTRPAPRPPKPPFPSALLGLDGSIPPTPLPAPLYALPPAPQHTHTRTHAHTHTHTHAHTHTHTHTGRTSSVVLSTTYLDERIRLGKGSRGSLFVFTRGGAADAAGERGLGLDLGLTGKARVGLGTGGGKPGLG